MTDEIETLTVGVRAEVSGFQRDVAAMRGTLEGPLVEGADKAGRMIETSLLRAVRSGRTGFEDLRRVVLSVMAEIAATALKAGLDSLLRPGGKGGGVDAGGGAPSGGSGGGGGVLALGSQLLGSVLGLPGRATGGPVSPGRAFLVGERGAEVFVPTSSGSVTPVTGGGRDVRIAIQVNAPKGENGRLLSRSARQVARAVKSALAE